MMPGQLKVTACITCVLAVVFYVFFQVSKHDLALSQVNAFAEDPFDAVGSFGVQFALFTALLSLLRALRPYQAHKVLDSQKLLLLRGEYISCLAVAVTLLADAVAMIRYPSLWIGSPAGHVLAVLLGGMALLTALVAWLIYRSARTITLSAARNGWTRAIAIAVVGILVLALYPENWRQSLPGAFFTVLVGVALLFVPVWALGIAIAPCIEAPLEDAIDDFVAVYRWLKAHTGPFIGLLHMFEKMRAWPFVCLALSWLNPRKHTWNFAILLGIFMGVVLLLAEISGQGGLPRLSQLVIVVSVYISLEAAGVLLGYFLFARLLGLFRQG